MTARETAAWTVAALVLVLAVSFPTRPGHMGGASWGLMWLWMVVPVTLVVALFVIALRPREA